jgi:hypothetical protein
LAGASPVASTFALLERKCRFSLIYATELLLIKTGFFRDKNSLHLDALLHSTTSFATLLITSAFLIPNPAISTRIGLLAEISSVLRKGIQ